MTEDATQERSMLAELRGFGRAFWLVNSIEMFERGAYYGVVSILTFHLVTQLRIATTTVGLAIGLLQALLYFVPLVASALSEKYGYRKGLIAAFALALTGYLLLGFLGPLRALAGDAALIPGIVLLGFGAGTFKPIAAAAIARATTEEQRNLGFTIYYAGVNVGGFLGPLLIGVFAPAALYDLVFFGAAAAILLNLAVSVLVYRDTQAPQSGKTVGEALRALVDLRKDPLYLALLLVYSGFWFMYAQQQFFLGQYASDFGIVTQDQVALVATINPGVIILVGPFIGKLTQRLPSLPLVVAGSAVYVLGYVVLALFHDIGLFMLGVAVFSAGEVMVQPSFLSYSSKVAPKDRVAVYLGYSFLPVGVGLVLGSAFGAQLYHTYAEVQHTPAAYWALSCLAGVLCMVGVLALNRVIARQRSDPSGELGARAKRAVHSRAAPVAALLIVPLLLVAASAPGAQPFLREGAAGGGDAGGAGIALASVHPPPVTGSTSQGQSSIVTVHVAQPQARNLTLTLTWSDEPPQVPAETNQPDKFQLTVTAPNGTQVRSDAVANPPGGEGRIVVQSPMRAGAADGDYNVTITLVDAGDVMLGPITASPDDSNAWTLDYRYDAPKA